jgi:hypothetical protein
MNHFKYFALSWVWLFFWEKSLLKSEILCVFFPKFGVLIWRDSHGFFRFSFAAIKTPRGCPSRAASSAAHVLTGMLTERLTVVVPVDFRPALARFPPWVGFFMASNG